MPHNKTHTQPPRASRLLGPIALVLALVACAPNAFAQGRKPTVEDASETTPARTQEGANTQGQTDAPRGVRARRVNASQPAEETEAGASRAIPAPAPAVEPKETAKDAATVVPDAKEVSSKEVLTKEASAKEPASKESASKGTLTKEPAAKDEALTMGADGAKDVPAAKDVLGAKDVPAAKGASAPKASVAVGVEAELEDLRARALAATSNAERAQLQRALAERLIELNRTEDAVTVLRALMREERFDPVGLYNVGNALARLDDAQAAAEAYRKAVAQKNGHYSRALNNLGVVLTRLGHWDEAATALNSALREENGNYAEASFNLGRLQALRGEREQAAGEWLRALALDPAHAGAAVALARSYADGGEPERALKLLDNFNANLARRKAPAPPEVELARREIINTHNLPPDARGGQLVADERNVSATHDARPADRLAAAPTREENARAATNNSVATERPAALTLGQQTYDLLQRARAARGAGRHEESVGLYRRTLARHGGYLAPANLELGYALANLQRPDEAIAALAQVAARDGARYPVVFYHLGRLYESTNRLPSAAAAFARAAQLSGERNPQAFLDLSRVREKEGDNAAALAAMEDYARALSRAGSLPEWAATRLAQLRQKAAPATKQ